MGLVTDVVSIVQKKYTDIDMNFTRNPGNSDIFIKSNEEAVKQSVRNLLLTKPFDRPFNPMLSSQLGDLLFQPWNPLTRSSMVRVISDLLSNYEPRIHVNNITVTNRNDVVDVILEFTIINISKAVTYSISIERLR